MGRIEIDGKWVFDRDSIEFHFADSEKVLDFGAVDSMEKYRAALIGVISEGTKLHMEQLLSKSQPDQSSQPKSGVGEMASRRVDNVLERTEQDFREHQRRTSEALEKAKEDYEAATSNILR